MGFLDKFKTKAVEAVDQHGDTVKGGLNKAGEFIDKKTGGQYTDKINTGKRKVEGSLDKLGKKKDGAA